MSDSPDGLPLLAVDNLVVSFTGPNGSSDVVKGVSFCVGRGETVAIVGESGSGKSTMAMSVIRLLAANGKIRAGSIRFENTDLTTKSDTELRSVRGRLIGLVPQDPMSNLNPSMKIGTQVAETLLTHGFATRRDVRGKSHEALRAAGIPEPEQRAAQYPHELSGGLRQRVLVAIGLACPKLLIADEPTSALDVTVQRTILDQIDRMTAEIGTAVLLITHDLALAAERAQRIIVMNEGRSSRQGPLRRFWQLRATSTRRPCSTPPRASRPCASTRAILPPVRRTLASRASWRSGKRPKSTVPEAIARRSEPLRRHVRHPGRKDGRRRGRVRFGKDDDIADAPSAHRAVFGLDLLRGAGDRDDG